MSRSGDVNEPTREFPEYAKGQATGAHKPGEVDRPSDEAGRPAAPGHYEDAAGLPLEETRRGPSGRSLIFLAGVIGLIAVLLFGMKVVGLWPEWRNPFAQQETDRSQPPLLKSIQDLSRYVAAEGNFQVIVDLQKDRKNLPNFLLNERTLFVGVGTVESYVDFGKIGEGAVIESADKKSVEIKLPAPQLGEVNLDLQKSYVFAEQRGVLNRLGDLFDGDPNRQQEVYQRAEEDIAKAARDSGLSDRAQVNTRKMLEGLLRSLGYENVTINYTAP